MKLMEILKKDEDDGYILGEKAAKEQLDKMLKYYRIKVDKIEDKILKNAIKGGIGRLIESIRYGELEFKFEDGIQTIQHLKNGKGEIKYREIDGRAKTQMAGKEPNDHYGKSYALMGALSEWGEDAIQNLKGTDLSLTEVLGLVFLSV